MKRLSSTVASGLGILLASTAHTTAQLVSTINFAPLAFVNGIEDLALADINADGNTDIVCAYRTGPTAAATAVVSIIFNSGGTPAFAPTFAANATASIPIIASGATRIRIRVGDVLGNALREVVAYSQNAVGFGGGAIRILTAISSPTGTAPFTTTVLDNAPAAGFDDFALLDYDYDGDLDIAEVIPGNSVLAPDLLQVINNNGLPPFAQFPGSPIVIGTISTGSRMAIENGTIDGIGPLDDLVVRSGPTNFETMTVLLDDFTGVWTSGQAYFLSPTNIAAAAGAMGLALADFNGDGLSDADVYFVGANAHALASGALPSYASVSISLNAGGLAGVVTTGPLDASTVQHAVSGDANGSVCLHLNNGIGQFNVGLTAPFCLTAGAPVRRLAIDTVEFIGTTLPDIAIATTVNIQIWGQ